jgi:flagellar hook-associated protein 3 FlgL
MRVTSRSLVDSALRNIQQNAQSLERLQNQIGSGKRLTRPSDDPAAVWRGLRMRREQSNAGQHLRNMDEARNWLGSTDKALDALNGTLAKLRELAVQASDDSNNTADRRAIATQVAELKDYALSIFNGANYVGQTLFSGRKTTTAPFSEDAAGNVVYDGETGITIPAGSTDLAAANGIQALTLTDADSAVEGTYRLSVTAPVNPGDPSNVTITRYDAAGVAVPGATQSVAVTIPTGAELSVIDLADLGLTLTVNSSLGSVPFAESATSQFTAVHTQIHREIGPTNTLPVNLQASRFLTMFQDLGKLESALDDDDQPNIALGISNLDTAIELTLNVQAEVGTRLNRLEVASERMTTIDDEANRIQLDAENVDMAEALTRLTTQQAIYSAALQTAAQAVPMSILDFLR